VFGAADRVVVLSEYWRDVLSDRVAPEKIAVFPNAVDPSEYDPEFGDDPLHVVFVSNLIERKGVPELLATLRALDERGLAYRATIAGKGPLADAVEQLAANSPNVEYVGYVSEKHKRELLDAGAIYALPTHAEGLPIAMLEGMAGGNAVVSTTVGSIPEVIEETGGILLEPGDSDGLAEALAALIADPDRARAMARRNRALVEEEYAWAETTDRLAELYATVQRDHVARS
jgi:glycosyltransferase involved in cell wall biosynthesis